MSARTHRYLAACKEDDATKAEFILPLCNGNDYDKQGTLEKTNLLSEHEGESYCADDNNNGNDYGTAHDYGTMHKQHMIFTY